MNADADVAQRKRNAVESFMMTRVGVVVCMYNLLLLQCCYTGDQRNWSRTKPIIPLRNLPL